MRALMQDTFGDPAEVLHLVDRDVPEPAAGQVRLRVALSPIHNHDLWTIRGNYGFVPPLPAPAGTEVFGIIDALGEGVTGFTVGQRVVTGSAFGTWAEYAVVPAAGLVPVPDTIPDESAAQLVSMPFSAISLLDALNLEPGAWVVQNSANGAVGRLFAQLAATRGINVLGLVRRESAREGLAAHGVTRVVATESADWREEAARITGGAEISVGIDSVGGSASNDLVSLLADGAKLVIFGAMGSPVVEIDSAAVIFRNISVVGFWGSKVSAQLDNAKKGALFGELFAAIGAGAITLPVAGVFDASDISAAVTASATTGRDGKVLLRF